MYIKSLLVLKYALTYHYYLSKFTAHEEIDTATILMDQ